MPLLPVGAATTPGVPVIGAHDSPSILYINSLIGEVAGSWKAAKVSTDFGAATVATRSAWANVEGQDEVATVAGRSCWTTLDGGMEILR
jgi:hypothetical protein